MFEVISIIGVVLFVIFVVASVWINVFLIKKLMYFNENVSGINNSIDQYVKHLESVYELPLFYGDDNLRELLDHSKQLREELYGFKETYRE
tara:strand:+ start:1006 stop:1278 length:273 start_codon:yes stop_codon:yes gene_type:complete